MSTIVAMALVLLGFFFIVVRAVLRVHRGQVTTGREGLVGMAGTALSDFDGQGRGTIRVYGEIWDAVSGDALLKDDAVEVIELEGMVLKVKKRA